MSCQICQAAYSRPVGTMNISLPDSLKEFVDEQVAERGYGTSSEYVRELIRKEKDHSSTSRSAPPISVSSASPIKKITSFRDGRPSSTSSITKPTIGAR